jgi:hypothetical protein
MSADWRAELAPAQAPAPPGWWPPAPGWWALALLLVLLIAVGLRVWGDPVRVRRRAALRELARIRAREDGPVSTARALENLLRRYALAQFGRERVAGLGGRRWLEFAHTVSGGRLAGEVGESLLASAFGGVVPDDPPAARAAWLKAAEVFVRRAALPRARAGGGSVP